MKLIFFRNIFRKIVQFGMQVLARPLRCRSNTAKREPHMSYGNIFDFELFNRRRARGRGASARARTKGIDRGRGSNRPPVRPTAHDHKRRQQHGIRLEVREILEANFDRIIECGNGEVALTLTKSMSQRLIDEGNSPQIVELASKLCIVATSDLSRSKTTMPLYGRRKRRYRRQFPTYSMHKCDAVQ